MTLLSPDAGRTLLAQAMLGNASVGNITANLYKNNYTPSAGSVLASFTLSTDPSYLSISLTAASFSVGIVSTVCTATYPAVTFTFSGAETLYGYFIESSNGSTVIWAELFPSPFTFTTGGNIVLLPEITLSNS